MLRILVMCLGLMPVLAGAQDASVPSVTVVGEGRATAVPDMAEITLGVLAQNRSAAEAMDEASEVVQAIFDLMPRFGIEPVDVQTSDLSLSPVWDQRGQGEPPRVAGYQASNRVTVRVRDLAQLGPVLDAVLDTGANRMDGLHFSIAEPGPLLTLARERAVADARRRAETYAAAAGVTVGAVLSITENGDAVGPVPMMEMARASSVPIAAGEAGITANVTMRFAIVE